MKDYPLFVYSISIRFAPFSSRRRAGDEVVWATSSQQWAVSG